MDYYAALGVGSDASAEDIKRAFRRLSQAHHPDVRGDADIYQAITEAYHVLSSPERRERYDYGLLQDDETTAIPEAWFVPGDRVQLLHPHIVGTVTEASERGSGFNNIVIQWDSAHPAVEMYKQGDTRLTLAGPDDEPPDTWTMNR